MTAELMQQLYAECGRSIACRRAVDYYIALVKNPCYPPADRMTQDMRRYYRHIIERYGPPPQCNIRSLVEERLRGTALEKYAHEVAEVAERLKRELHITSRVAAAAAALVVADKYGMRVSIGAVAQRFGANYVTVSIRYKDAVRLGLL